MLPPAATPRVAWSILAVLLVGVGALMWSVASEGVVGFHYDEGEYLVSGRALVAGDGYRLTHLPTEPPQVRHPIGYPLVLGVASWLTPTFPANGMALKSINVLLALVALTGTSFHFLAISTSLLPEAAFLVTSLIALWRGERALRGETRWWTVGAWVTLAFHLRTIGIALAAAVLLVTAVRRQWRAALTIAAIFVIAGLGPWLAWTHTHSPHPNTEADTTLLVEYLGFGSNVEEIAEGGALGVARRTTHGFVVLGGQLADSLLPIIASVPEFLPRSLEEDAAVDRVVSVGTAIARLLVVALFALPGVVSLGRRELAITPIYLLISAAALAFWNAPDDNARFLVVLLPLCWLYFFAPILPALRSDDGLGYRWIALPAFVVVMSLHPATTGILALNTQRTGDFTPGSLGSAVVWSEYEAALRFLNPDGAPDPQGGVASASETNAGSETDVPGVVATREEVVWHLYAGRKTVHLGAATFRGRDVTAAEVLEHLIHWGVDTIVVEPERRLVGDRVAPNEAALRVLAADSGRFERVFVSPHRLIEIYRLRTTPVDASESPPESPPGDE